MATAAADAVSGAGEGLAGVPSSVPGGGAAAVAAGGPGAPACSAVDAYEEPDCAASSAGALGQLLCECNLCWCLALSSLLQPAAHARRAPWGCANEAHSRWHISNLGLCVRRRPVVIMPCTCCTGPETGWRACGLQARAASAPAPGRAAWSPTPLQAAAVHAPPGTPLLRRRRTDPRRAQASAAPPAGRARAPTQMAAAAARRRPRTALPRASP